MWRKQTELRDLSQPMSVRLRPVPYNGAPIEVVVCVNQRKSATSCGERGGGAIAAALERGLAVRGLDITLRRRNCLGPCLNGPNLCIFPGASWIAGAQPGDVPEILDLLGQLVKEQTAIATPVARAPNLAAGRRSNRRTHRLSAAGPSAPRERPRGRHPTPARRHDF